MKTVRVKKFRQVGNINILFIYVQGNQRIKPSSNGRNFINSGVLVKGISSIQ